VNTKSCICMWALLCASLLVAAEEAPPCALITVAAGDQARIDTPVSAALPPEVNAGRELALFEVKDAVRIPVPAQVAFGSAREHNVNSAKSEGWGVFHINVSGHHFANDAGEFPP
jgi:hypothetical protein